MATNLSSCFSIEFLEQLLKFLINFTLSKYVLEKLWLFNHKRADFWLPNFGFKRSLLSLLKTQLLVGRGPADYSDACVALYFYVSSPSDLVSTVITRSLCNCLVKKVNHGTDVFTHKHTELPASSTLFCVFSST